MRHRLRALCVPAITQLGALEWCKKSPGQTKRSPPFSLTPSGYAIFCCLLRSSSRHRKNGPSFCSLSDGHVDRLMNLFFRSPNRSDIENDSLAGLSLWLEDAVAKAGEAKDSYGMSGRKGNLEFCQRSLVLGFICTKLLKFRLRSDTYGRFATMTKEEIFGTIGTCNIATTLPGRNRTVALFRKEPKDDSVW
uniref:RUN domain-containing protein n=1 Tax=Steinernema glaseri TaxID=37863 RepID=A0A1I7ZSM4_9BILA